MYKPIALLSILGLILVLPSELYGQSDDAKGEARLFLADEINVRSTGAICDGSSHPIGTQYATLGEAQHDFPFITSLSQEMDYAGIQLATYRALGWAGFEHGINASANRGLYIPPGTCLLGNDTWTIRNAVGVVIRGASRLASKIRSNSTVLAFDGLWYSRIENIAFVATSSNATTALDLDGNIPGHPYPTRGVQGNTLKDVLIDGGGSNYSMALCRRGTGGGQCSENQYYDLHLLNASFAVYFQSGFNAIDNNWFGGDCQVYKKHCIYLLAGSIGVYKVSFESTTGYTQIENDGFDIDASNAGAYDTIVAYGSRTELMRFYRGSWSQIADIRAITQRIAGFGPWSAKSALRQNYLVSKQGTDGLAHAYRVSVAGVTGDSEPVWPASGTVVDGSLQWTMISYNAVEIMAGTVDLRTSFFDPTAGINAATTRYMTFKEVNANYRTNTSDELIIATPLNNDITVLLFDDATHAQQRMGHTITIKRSVPSTNTVTIQGAIGGDLILPPNTLDSATFVHAYGNNRGPTWYLISYTPSSKH